MYLYLHKCHVINNIKSNTDITKLNGCLLYIILFPSRTELSNCSFKLIAVFYYEYEWVFESERVSLWRGDCGAVSGWGYVVVSGRVSRNIQVCFRSYHIGVILYYVLTTIKFSTFLKWKYVS